MVRCAGNRNLPTRAIVGLAELEHGVVVQILRRCGADVFQIVFQVRGIEFDCLFTSPVQSMDMRTVIV